MFEKEIEFVFKKTKLNTKKKKIKITFQRFTLHQIVIVRASKNTVLEATHQAFQVAVVWIEKWFDEHVDKLILVFFNFKAKDRD